MAIEYRHKGRNEDAMTELRGLAEHSDAAERVRQCSDNMINALECLNGGRWDVHLDHDAGLVAFSRSVS